MLTSNQFSNSLIKDIDITSQSSPIISEASDIQIEFEFEEDQIVSLMESIWQMYAVLKQKSDTINEYNMISVIK